MCMHVEVLCVILFMFTYVNIMHMYVGECIRARFTAWCTCVTLLYLL